MAVTAPARLPLTRLCAKPHVAVFISNYFRPRIYPSPDGIKPGLVAPRLHGRGLIFDAIAFHLTQDPHRRMIATPQGLLAFEILMPQGYRQHYLDASNCQLLAKSLEDIFWNEAEKYVAKAVSEFHFFKEDAIRLFYERYGIIEDLYPIGNFRRQILRYGIAGNAPAVPEQYHYSHKLNNKECMQMYRMRKAGMSYRKLGTAYNISHMQAKRIVKKIMLDLSQNVTEMLHF